VKKNKSELIYGLHAVESALKHGCENVLAIWVLQGRNDKRAQGIVKLAQKHGISIEAISADKMKKKCPDARHQGVIASIRPSKKHTVALEDILGKDKLLLLILDGVQDPHNIGACLRTADAAGVDAVIVSKNRSPGLTAVVRKVASGAAETVPYIMVSNLARAMQQLRDDNVWIIGTSGETDTSIYDISATQRMAVVMGSEGKGMRRLTRDNCDELVSIPMLGTVESLNISVATGISLFEVRQKIEST
jgi:23S rRNA (guanosine2251-2'-O)-methyltransferase